MGTSTAHTATGIAAAPRRDVAIRQGGGAAGGELRLTRRGRVVVVLLFLVLLLGSLLALGGYSAASDASDARGAAEETRTVVVGEGDTLWDIAAEVAVPGEDVRTVVHALQELNALPGPELAEGQRIAVPTQ